MYELNVIMLIVRIELYRHSYTNMESIEKEVM
ncbi:hypothetical protein VMF7928_04476 [Vibrio marisflavi CECT 7928]|uniref:Uncharacterized protein n=1 Tax=Vibrio marisflavi CECT 7928 TaxID=634439 RepID=A0ABM9A9F3_9VIBR|nr:hypothetical protein VMF7928_04476 [Vibrio marisflavi CECT 7928]